MISHTTMSQPHIISSQGGPRRRVTAKVWAYRELSGKKYFEVLLDDGTRARIDFLEGLTTQQSLVALGRALERKFGSCCITAMNKRSLFDESDGLSEEQQRKLSRTLGTPMRTLDLSLA
jgi:hypothetical protein